MIRGIDLKGFKGHNLSVDLDSVTILVGRHNSGKSAIVGALSFLQHVVSKSYKRLVEVKGGANFFTSEKKVSIGIMYEDWRGTYTLDLIREGDSLSIDQETVIWQDQSITLKSEDGETSLGSGYNTIIGRADRVLRGLRIYEFPYMYHSAEYSYTSPFLLNYADMNPIVYNNMSNTAVAMRVLHENSPQVYDRFLDNVRVAIPELVRFDFTCNENCNILHYVDKSGKRLPVYILSPNTQRYIAYLTAIMQPLPPILLVFDDFDVYFEQYLLEVLALEIKKRVFSSHMLIVAQFSDFPKLFDSSYIVEL